MTIVEFKKIGLFVRLPYDIIPINLIIEDNDGEPHKIRYFIIKSFLTIKLINNMKMILIQFLQNLLHILFITNFIGNAFDFVLMESIHDVYFLLFDSSNAGSIIADDYVSNYVFFYEIVVAFFVLFEQLE